MLSLQARNWTLSVLVTLGAVCTTTAAKAEFLYGTGLVGGVNRIYQINTTGFVETLLPPSTVQVIPGTAQANAVAVDPDRVELFVLGGDDNLYIWRNGTNLLQAIATPAQLGITSTSRPLNAAFYDGSYWFFPSNTNTLRRVNFNTTPTQTLSFNNFVDYTIDGLASLTAFQRFGDIAINSSGRLYAATSGIQTTSRDTFYTINLAGLPNANTTVTVASARYQNICTASVNPNPTSRCVPTNLQLAFNSTDTNLFGVSNVTDLWYNVSQSITPVPPTGTVATSTGIASPSELFDLSDVSLRQAIVPAPLPVIGLLAAFGWSRKLRKRALSQSTRLPST
ncbi:hypothetical protein KQ306_00805 [Synechococcus sp. CS-1324]|uniref:hypothetical protein n=1 Tax=Synechococcus sp. CS-1324 TaxID=2847980 RepID=UPI00223B1F35|nr:hypothetical protein [Synechococcus sp. CS-1324]MCT0229403.1 hypothetical protein [Synechococcus sp. CS-1324]